MKKEIESKLSFSDRISAHVKVKVTKKEPDNNRHLCGDPVKTDKDGNEYFIIPEHQAVYIASTFPRYTISKGYLSQDALSDLNAESDINKQSVGEAKEEDEGEGTTEKPKARGNPNWRKKLVVAETGLAGNEHQLVEA